MEKIKTYPLQFTEKDLQQIKEAARKVDLTLRGYIHEAIKEKMDRDK